MQVSDTLVHTQALGSVAFAYSFSFILLEITVHLRVNADYPLGVHLETR